MDILTIENLSSIWLANMKIIYWLVSSSSMCRGDLVNGVDGVFVILASCMYHFIEVNESLVQQPINNISIGKS